MKSVQEQFTAIVTAFPGSTMTYENGCYLVIIPRITLPKGWSANETHIRFVIPNGYPYAAPDCFWADYSLRLEQGQMPQNTQIGQVVPSQPNAQTLWFSWHIANGAWNAATCDLLTYVKIIRSRFEELK
ncbi:E2/UBC family protein [Methylomonas sp. MK1]|uniref:E2/UBC family protein n=1 Tax=Methylomonas sp. MK1 TaxID=1131552 RepID=UPI00037969DA|nr:E2/UBC family protein [Methylomonas sp. MK1]